MKKIIFFLSIATISISNVFAIIIKNKPSDCNAPARPGVNWSGCDKSNLTEELINANLTDAILRDTNFTGSTLKNTILSGADIFDANFSAATLDKVDLSKVKNFSRAIWKGAIFYFGTTLGKVDVTGLDFEKTQFVDTDLSGFSNFNKVSSFKNAQFHFNDLSKHDLIGLNFENAFFNGVYFSNNLTFNKAKWANTMFKCDVNICHQKEYFENIDVSGVDFSGVKFRNFKIVSMKNAGKAKWNGADLDSVKFVNTNLNGIAFKSTNLANISFGHGSMFGTDLRGPGRRKNFRDYSPKWALWMNGRGCTDASYNECNHGNYTIRGVNNTESILIFERRGDGRLGDEIEVPPHTTVFLPIGRGIINSYIRLRTKDWKYHCDSPDWLNLDNINSLEVNKFVNDGWNKPDGKACIFSDNWN